MRHRPWHLGLGRNATDSDIEHQDVAWPAGTYDLQGRGGSPSSHPGQVLLHVDSRGTVTKEVVVRMD